MENEEKEEDLLSQAFILASFYFVLIFYVRATVKNIVNESQFERTFTADEMGESCFVDHIIALNHSSRS
jgi:hypothetical protein